MSKPLVCVYMGQAAVVYLTEYNLYSGQFSSCCPVVLFNQNTKRAGYYHMPGKTNQIGQPVITDLDRRDWRIVEEMAVAVAPTKVWIFPGIGIASVVAARDPMQAAFNARPLAMNLSNVPVEIPEQSTGNLAVTLKGDDIDFSKYRPDYHSGEWIDSKRDIENQPDGVNVLFWKWKMNVTGFRQLS